MMFTLETRQLQRRNLVPALTFRMASDERSTVDSTIATAVSPKQAREIMKER